MLSAIEFEIELISYNDKLIKNDFFSLKICYVLFNVRKFTFVISFATIQYYVNFIQLFNLCEICRFFF